MYVSIIVACLPIRNGPFKNAGCLFDSVISIDVALGIHPSTPPILKLSSRVRIFQKFSLPSHTSAAKL